MNTGDVYKRQGSDGDQGLEGQALLAHIHDLHLGPRHGIQLLLLNRLGIGLGEMCIRDSR